MPLSTAAIIAKSWALVNVRPVPAFFLAYSILAWKSVCGFQVFVVLATCPRKEVGV